jgi:hypothetical protein
MPEEEKLTQLGDPDLAVDEYGMIRSKDPARDFDGLHLRALLDCMRQSSWDWPSAMFAIGGLDHEDEPTMYPGDREIAWLKEVAPEADWSNFDTMWDT